MLRGVAELADLDVLVLDLQASGATPAHGHMLSFAAASTTAEQTTDPLIHHWVQLPQGATVPRPVRKLLDYDEALGRAGIPPQSAWRALTELGVPPPRPTVIHFASFELRFLHDLWQRFGQGEPFPFDVVCLHQIARRLFPDLARRGLRPLAGYLGHSTDLKRDAAGHVEASAFVWRALAPNLVGAGLSTWSKLKEWLAAPAPKRGKRHFLLDRSRARELPDEPGVYRFLRSNGDVLYIGKAESLRKRVASHFTASKANERALEMLTQVARIEHERTETALEAALLETDLIKSVDPPYNVQLRERTREVAFATLDFSSAEPRADRDHRLGPLPSRFALSSLAAIVELKQGAEPDGQRAARALGVPASFAPEPEDFAVAWRRVLALPTPPHRSARGWALRLALTLWPERERIERSPRDHDPGWDPDRIERHLLRAILRGGQLVRRAPWLTLLESSEITFEEPGRPPRRLCFGTAAPVPVRFAERRALFDGASYDRMRVLLSELLRVRGDGGEVSLRIGGAPLAPARLGALLDRL